MYIKYFLSIVTFVLFVVPCMITAQTVQGGMLPLGLIEKTVFDTAQVQVYYEYSYRKDSVSNKRTEGQAVLLIGKHCLGFDDFYKRENDRLNDSLFIAKGSPMELLTHGMGLLQRKAYNFPLVIDLQKREATIQADGINSYEYTQPVPQISWRECEDDSTICDVPCKKATCRFGGREWTAWYAPSFPLQAGPYLFGGLPGLIFSISDNKDNYRFTLNGVENLRHGTKIYLRAGHNIIKTTREKVRRAIENEHRDVRKAFEMQAQSVRFSGKTSIRKSKPYNPIELE